MADKGFSPDWLGELKSRNDIVSTISRYIKLDRKGKNHWGCCPFHFEKTPSFSVNEVDQFYHCFGCGVSGDVISFIEKYENVEFYDAVKILAKNAGMEIPNFVQSEEIAKRKEEKEQALHALLDAAIFYRQILFSSKGKPAMNYLLKRGVNSKSIATFGLGYSTDFESLKNFLESKGYSIDLLKKAGLVDINNGRAYDSFGGRLMFPLINMQGEVVGFSGRLIENKDFAKYKNSSQNIVFDKSRTVFGINLAKKLRNELRNDLQNVILVEGQLDVVSMHQAGYKNTVACLGTALTPQHCKELEKLTNNVIVMLDGDEAGKKATLRSLEVLASSSNLSVKVVSLPEGCDPDEFIKKYGKEKMDNLLSSAIESLDYQIKSLAELYNLDSNEQRSKFIKQALIKINKLSDSSTREIYLGLIRKLTNVPVDILRQDLNNLETNSEEIEVTQPKEETIKLNEDAFVLADKFILASLLHRKSYAKLDDCSEIEFMDNDLNTLYEYIKNGTKDKPALVSGVFDRIDVQENPLVLEIINFSFGEENNDEIIWKDCLIKNEQRKLDRQKDILEKEWKKSDLKERIEIGRKMQEIDKRRFMLKSKK